jgi:hypothetical protein
MAALLDRILAGIMDLQTSLSRMDAQLDVLLLWLQGVD